MIDDKIYDRFLQTIRDGEADVGTVDIRIEGRWQTIDFRPALARLVAERDERQSKAREETLRTALIRMVDAVEKEGSPRQRALVDAFLHALKVLDKKKVPNA